MLLLNISNGCQYVCLLISINKTCIYCYYCCDIDVCNSDSFIFVFVRAQFHIVQFHEYRLNARMIKIWMTLSVCFNTDVQAHSETQFFLVYFFPPIFGLFAHIDRA